MTRQKTLSIPLFERRGLATWVAAIAFLATAAAAQTEIERRVDARADGTVEITNVAGSVTVVGWDQDEVELSGVLGRGVDEVEIESHGGRTKIKVEYGSRGGHQATADLEARVPRGSRVVVETVSADLRVSELDGDVDLESVSGSIEVRGHPHSVEAETVSGNVEVEDALSRIVAESVNGTIVVRGGTEIEAGTVSGSLRLLGLEGLRRVDVEVVSGRIELEGSLAKGAQLDISSHNGSIDVALPESVSARFDVSSFSGRIENELGPPARRERFSPGRELEFTAGSGEGRIRIESFAGSITLRKR